MIERTGTRPEQATPVPDAPFVRANGETRAGVSLPAMTRFVRAIEPRESEHRLRPKVRLALQPTPRPCTAGGASIQAQRRTGGRCHRSRERSAVPEVAAFPVERESSRLHAVPTPLWSTGNLPSSPSVGDGVACLTDGYVAGGVG